MRTEDNPNARMVLERNPNFRRETYPCEGEAEDKDSEPLKDEGQVLPFIDKLVFAREKEQIPYWNKFLQGHYDAFGISSDAFDQAVQVSTCEITLSDDTRVQGIVLTTSVATSTFCTGFNWLHPLLGGSDPKTAQSARKLRQAISLVIDQGEFISMFQNGRGVAAQGPGPPPEGFSVTPRAPPGQSLQEYDRLFERVKAMENGASRQELSDRMTDIMRHDAPWACGFHPEDRTLRHAWLSNRKQSKVGHNTLKYQRVDAALREQRRAEWNRPVLWSLLAVVLVLGAAIWPAWRGYRRRETATTR